MNNIKRVFRYVKGRYHLFFLSLSLIIIIQGLGFLSPLIVKTILDDYILGIEKEFSEIGFPHEEAVFFNDHYYVQTRFLDGEEVVYQKASLVLDKTGIYFINDAINLGKKEIKANTLFVTTKEGQVFSYQATKLTAKEVFLFYNPLIPTLFLLIALLFIRSVIVIFASYAQHLSTNRVVSLVARDARTEAMRSVERLPIKYFEAEPAGKMAARITHDVDGMIIMYRLMVNSVIQTVISFVLAYVGMFILDAKLALLTFIIYPLIYLWVKFFLKHLKKLAEKVNELKSLLTAKINEIINGINILQVFNFQKQTVKEFNEINNAYRNEQLKEVKLHITAGWNMIGIMRATITTIIVIYFGLQHLSLANTLITAGLIYAYNEYLLKIIEPVNVIFVSVGDFQHSLVRIERISKLIEGELEDDATGRIERYIGGVNFNNIWFAYKDDNYVLKGVSLDIPAGKMVGIVGHTGSGKTTLMNLLLRYYDLSDEKSGQITVDGVPINKYPKRIYRQHIGVVLQEPALFKGTIATNVRFGKEDISDEEVKEILIRLGGKRLIEKFPLGVLHPITRLGSNLSSGEKQLISLARVIVHNPSILVMDEATSHIDTETEEMIKTALKVIAKDRTVIVIAHRLSTIYNADKIIVLDHGLKVEEGRHSELIALNAYYANMYRAQQANSKQM